jgi:hypothetical protein
MKPLLFTFFLFISTLLLGQDSYPIPLKYNDYISIDHSYSTFFKKPAIGIMWEREIFDDKYKFSIPARTGYYQLLDNSLRKENLFLVQLGVIFEINKKVSLGTYLINFQGDLPRDLSYRKDPNYVGYTSPISAFAKINTNYIIRSGFFSKSSLFFEYNYYNYFNKGAFKMTFTQKIFKTKT